MFKIHLLTFVLKNCFKRPFTNLLTIIKYYYRVSLIDGFSFFYFGHRKFLNLDLGTEPSQTTDAIMVGIKTTLIFELIRVKGNFEHLVRETLPCAFSNSSSIILTPRSFLHVV